MLDPGNRSTLLRRIGSAAAFFLAVLVVGVLGYLWIGDGRWSVSEVVYMVVITVSTVGYGEMLPGLAEVRGARTFTLFLILGGTGAMVYLTTSLTAFVVEADLGGYLRRRAMDREIEQLSGHYILAGLGGVGAHIARAVHSQGHSLVVIEQESGKFDRHELGFRPLHVVGDATEESVLEDAGIHRASGLVAALSHDRDNLFLVFTACSMEPTLRVVAKVVDPVNARKIKRAGATEVVSPASLGGIQLAAALLQPELANFVETLGHDSSDPHVIEELPLSEDSPAVGHPLGDMGIRQHRNTLVLAIRTAAGPYLHNPGPDAVPAAGDALIVLVAVDVREEVRATVLGHG